MLFLFSSIEFAKFSCGHTDGAKLNRRGRDAILCRCPPRLVSMENGPTDGLSKGIEMLQSGRAERILLSSRQVAAASDFAGPPAIPYYKNWIGTLKLMRHSPSPLSVPRGLPLPICFRLKTNSTGEDLIVNYDGSAISPGFCETLAVAFRPAR